MPQTTGRFNYTIIGTSDCQVFFRPQNAVVQIVVAERLTKDQAFELMEDLNSVLDEHCIIPHRERRESR